MKISLINIFILILLFSCSTKEESKTKNETPVKSQTPDSAQEIEDHRFETNLTEELRDSLFINFSNDTLKDKFEIVVSKGNISNTMTIFRISDDGGNILFEEKFQTRSLINGYALPIGSSVKETQKYIEERVHTFFNNDSFIDPTKSEFIANADKEEYSDYEVWEEVRGKENSKAFIFALEEENINYLTYSPKLNKIVTFFSCC